MIDDEDQRCRASGNLHKEGVLENVTPDQGVLCNPRSGGVLTLVRSCEVVEEQITDTDTEGVRPSRPPEKSTRAYPLGLITYKEG